MAFPKTDRVFHCILRQPRHLKQMKSRPFKNYTSGFSNFEALVVIVVTITLAFVLVPALAYHLGWMQPSRRDMDIHLRAVKRPDIVLPPSYKSDAKIDDNEDPARGTRSFSP